MQKLEQAASWHLLWGFSLFTFIYCGIIRTRANKRSSTATCKTCCCRRLPLTAPRHFALYFSAVSLCVIANCRFCLSVSCFLFPWIFLLSTNPQSYSNNKAHKRAKRKRKKTSIKSSINIARPRALVLNSPITQKYIHINACTSARFTCVRFFIYLF